MQKTNETKNTKTNNINSIMAFGPNDEPIYHPHSGGKLGTKRLDYYWSAEEGKMPVFLVARGDKEYIPLCVATSHKELNEEFGGKTYYVSQTGLTGEGYFEPKAGQAVVELGTYIPGSTIVRDPGSGPCGVYVPVTLSGEIDCSAPVVVIRNGENQFKNPEDDKFHGFKRVIDFVDMRVFEKEFITSFSPDWEKEITRGFLLGQYDQASTVVEEETATITLRGHRGMGGVDPFIFVPAAFWNVSKTLPLVADTETTGTEILEELGFYPGYAIFHGQPHQAGAGAVKPSETGQGVSKVAQWCHATWYGVDYLMPGKPWEIEGEIARGLYCTGTGFMFRQTGGTAQFVYVAERPLGDGTVILGHKTEVPVTTFVAKPVTWWEDRAREDIDRQLGALADNLG